MALIGLLAYGSYLAAEVMGLSGILTLFVCGLAVSHLALPAASAEGRLATQTAFQALSYVSEVRRRFVARVECILGRAVLACRRGASRGTACVVSAHL